MTVRCIVGRAGSGKSQHILEEIRQALVDGREDSLMLLVPEQFTLQSERDLIQKLLLPGIIRVEVMSFTRLARRVFNEVGGLTRIILNDQGKNMVLRKIIDEVAGDLTIFKKAAAQEGFVAKFSELLAELKVQGVLPEELRTGTEQTELIIRHKCSDIALIWEHFNHYLEGRYLDTEDYMNLFIEKLKQAQFLESTRVWVDGFTTYSTRSLKIIGQIMPLVKDITICLTLDPNTRGRDSDLFDLSRRSLQQIQAMARSHGQSLEVIAIDSRVAGEYKPSAITHLEKELYAYPGQQMTGLVEGLELFAAANLNSEIEYAAAQIIELIREKEWRWKDIAVVCNDMNSYGSIIKRVFIEYGIPYFMDEKRDVMNNAIIKLILSSIEVVRRGYRAEDVVTFLKTGFSGLNSDQIEKLENYVLEYGIEGSKWKEKFSINNSVLEEEMNCCREEFIIPLLKLEKRLSGKNTLTNVVRAHYDYLLEIGLQAKLEEWIEDLNNQGRFEMVRENTQVWNIVLDNFDQMVEILGDQNVNLKEYRRILEAGFISLEVGIIPTTVDQVLVGEIQRSKSQDIKGMLVVGVNDGILPSGQIQEGLFTDSERQLLLDRGVDMGFELSQKFAEERFLIYTAMTKPLEYLGVSYASADSAGKALRPSLIIDRLKRLFPDLQEKSDIIKHPAFELHQVSTPASTFKYLVENLRLTLDAKPTESFWRDVYNWYHKQEDWQDNLSQVNEGLLHRNQAEVIGSCKASRLYPLPLHSSVSRIEQFVNCPFAHFVRYGLKPRERKMFAVRAPDIGELLHNSLHAFALQLQQENRNWAELERPDCDRIINGIMEGLVPLHSHGVFNSSHRYRHLAQRLQRISRRAAWVLTEHLQQGNFQPWLHEVGFGPGCTFPAVEIELADGQILYLQGRIDRVDLWHGEDGAYVKIIDYKSGSQDFKLSDVYYGLSLQLMIYLQAVLTSNQKTGHPQLKPGGVFYFKIDDPLIASESRVIEVIEKEIAKKFKMKGLILKDPKLLQQFDKEIITGSDIIPAAFTRSGEFTRSSSALEEADFIKLIAHIEGLLSKIGREIMDGQVKIEPVKYGVRNACQFCEFPAVCQFDRRVEGNQFRNIKPLRDEEVAARLQGSKEVQPDESLD